MDLVIGNWITGYHPAANTMLNSLLCDISIPNVLDVVSKCIKVEYMSGIKHSTIPFKDSISVQDIRKKLQCNCNLFLHKTELSPDNILTSDTTIIIIPILELIKLSSDDYTVEQIIAQLQDAEHTNFEIYIYNKLITDKMATHSNLRAHVLAVLGAVHNLTLDYCTGITDISALGTVHTLTLSGCPGITDVTALGTVHTLVIK